MFARFRQTPRRLQVSLIETHRVAGRPGRVQHQHVASLGSIRTPADDEPAAPADRIAFWTKLQERLER